MKYLKLNYETLAEIDLFFKTTFSYTDSQQIFNWTHPVNSEDIRIMFEDLKRYDPYISYYIPKRYMKSPISFLNFIIKNTHNFKHLIIIPNQSRGIFRTYRIVPR